MTLAIQIPESPPAPPSTPTDYPVRRFTVDEYHRMLEAGILEEGEPTELLEGWLMVEVCDSSLDRDSSIKARIYAAASIPQYWIVNVKDRVVQLHSDPSPDVRPPAYRTRREVRPGEMIPLVIDGVEIVQIEAAELLPA